MSEIRVNTFKAEDGIGSPSFPNGVNVTGVATATTFSGAVSGTTGTFSGAVSGTTGTFSGNVSVGGVLTYEDVTNIDSVGLITARAGINITGGNINLGDSSGSSDDRILLGASNDCHIHHNGTDTYISNDTGDLVLNNIGGNSDDIFVRSKDDITLQVQSSENAIVCKGDDSVELYYNGNKTIETFVNATHFYGNASECNLDFKRGDNGQRIGFIGITNGGQIKINGANGTGGSYETYLEGNLNGATKLFYDFSTYSTAKLETTATGVTVNGTVSDSKGDLRKIIHKQESSAYTLVAADAGKAIEIASGGITVPASVFGAGDAVTIINDSSSAQTITKGSGLNMFNSADATNSNRTLGGRGMATIYFVNSSTSYISGAGLS